MARQQGQPAEDEFCRNDPPADVVDLRAYYGLGPECRVSRIEGLSSGLQGPRTGTLFLFEEERQLWLNGRNEPYGGLYALESWENKATASRAAAELFVEVPPHRAFYIPALFAPGAFNGMRAVPPESIQAGMQAGFVQDPESGRWIRQPQAQPQPQRQTGPSSAMFAQQPQPQYPAAPSMARSGPSQQFVQVPQLQPFQALHSIPQLMQQPPPFQPSQSFMQLSRIFQQDPLSFQPSNYFPTPMQPPLQAIQPSTSIAPTQQAPFRPLRWLCKIRNSAMCCRPFYHRANPCCNIWVWLITLASQTTE